MDVNLEAIRSDRRHRLLAALRMGACATALAIGWFILSAVFGGTAASATDEMEPDSADNSLLGTVSSTVSTLTDPQGSDLQGIGGDVAEPLDAIVSELPIVPEVAGETQVQDVTSPVIHTAERVLDAVPGISDSPVGHVPETVAPVTATPTVADSIPVDPPSPDTRAGTASPRQADVGKSLASSPLPPTHDQPIPLAATASTGTAASSAGTPTAVGLSGAGWSPPSERAESSPAHSIRCPASATFDFDSTPD